MTLPAHTILPAMEDGSRPHALNNHERVAVVQRKGPRTSVQREARQSEQSPKPSPLPLTLREAPDVELERALRAS